MGKAENENTQIKGDGDSRITVNFPTVPDKIAFNNLLLSIVEEPKLINNNGRNLTKGEAAVLFTALAKKQFAIEGFGVGRESFTDLFYTILKGRINNISDDLKNVFINCDKGIDAIQKDCEKRVQDLKEKRENDRLQSDKILADNAEYISQLETQNANMSDELAVLKEQNEALSSLKESHDWNIEAWDKERKNLNEKLDTYKRVSEENANLLKQKKKIKEESLKLKDELAKLKHKYQIELKEKDLQYQKDLATSIKANVKETETQMEKKFSIIINELKAQIAAQKKEEKENISLLMERMNNDQMEFKKQLKESKNEERAIANAEIERLQEVIKGEMANVERAQILASQSMQE